MPAVLVHGVPETAAIWDRLRGQLQRADVLTLALPGFGVSRPAGFGATKEDYVAWLAAELAAIDGPVDLVGHDWGGGLVVRLVSTQPELVRSWVTDAAGLGNHDFEWHDMAKIWQTPGAGEDFFAQQLAAPLPDRAAVFEMFGVPPDAALEMAGWIDQTMIDCILALYRSATTVGIEWAPDFADIEPAGCVLLPADDPFLDRDSAMSGAARAGATTEPIAAVGHWWMLQDPVAGAAALERFWSSVG